MNAADHYSDTYVGPAKRLERDARVQYDGSPLLLIHFWEKKDGAERGSGRRILPWSVGRVAEALGSAFYVFPDVTPLRYRYAVMNVRALPALQARVTAEARQVWRLYEDTMQQLERTGAEVRYYSPAFAEESVS